MLLIAGGRGDPDLEWLADAAAHRGLPYVMCYCNSRDGSSIEWDLQTNSLIVDGTVIPPDDASLYIRYSMFDAYGEDSRDDCYALVESWYQSVKGWAFANPLVGMFNRHADVLGLNKPYNLLLARDSGFAVPETRILNHVDRVSDPENWIIKVPGDGAETKPLDKVLRQGDLPRVFNARPWIIQRKLDYPELRIFQVGKWQFGFEITNDTLDSRTGGNLTLKEVPVPDDLSQAMKRLKMDFAAADFKTCPDTGQFRFLEINSAPTFSGYDAKVNGRLSDAMILHLKKLAGPS